jgi:hypothetical protein
VTQRSGREGVQVSVLELMGGSLETTPAPGMSCGTLFWGECDIGSSLYLNQKQGRGFEKRGYKLKNRVKEKIKKK